MNHVEDPLFAQDEVPIRSELVREFNIESVNGQSFETKNGGLSTIGFESYLLTYDRSGNKIRHLKFNREAKINYEWTYDSKGRPFKEIAYYASGDVNYQFHFIYNHEDTWIEKRMYLHASEPHHVIIADRDVKGLLMSERFYDQLGQEIRTNSYIYDNDGRLVRLDMGRLGEWIYEYEKNDYLKRRIGNFPSADILGTIFEFQYNERGLLIQMDHLYRSTTTFQYHFYV